MFKENMNHLALLEAARQRAKERKVKEQNRFDSGKRPWGAYDEKLSLLDYSFDSAYPGGLSRFAKERGLFGKSFYALHLLGGTRSLRDLPHLSGGVAVTLNDFRQEDIRLLDDRKQIELVPHDVFTQEAWVKVEQYLSDHQRQGFDLIYSSPILGWDVIGLQPEVIWLLLNLAWQVLAENGMILLETIIGQSVSQGMLVFFLQQNKIKAQEKGRVIILRKKKGDSHSLPEISY